MEIVGYSERGAMNALFYGIALNRDEKAANEAMNVFLRMAGETETFHNFKLYSEFSLSGFGAPDFVITAENQSGETIVFFIEAKASACKCYNLKEEKRRHEEYIKDHTKYADGHSSNLFFQLKEKFLLLKYGPNNDSRIRIIDRRRKLGGNEIVCKFYKDIKSDWQNSRYIAVIPKQEDYQENPVSMVFKNGNDSCEFDIHLIYWEDIKENDILKGYVIITFIDDRINNVFLFQLPLLNKSLLLFFNTLKKNGCWLIIGGLWNKFTLYGLLKYGFLY